MENFRVLFGNYSKQDSVAGKICSGLSEKYVLGSRICTASLPFLKLYQPFNAISLNIDNAVLVLTTIRNMGPGLRDQDTSKQFAAFASGAVTVLSIVNFRCATIISVAYDVFSSVQKREYLQIFLNGARFVVLFHPIGLELQVAVAAVNILMELGNSYKEFKDDHYIESIAGVAIAAIKAYQVRPQLSQLTEKYFPAPSPQYHSVVPHRVSAQLPEGYDPFGDDEKNEETVSIEEAEPSIQEDEMAELMIVDEPIEGEVVIQEQIPSLQEEIAVKEESSSQDMNETQELSVDLKEENSQPQVNEQANLSDTAPASPQPNETLPNSGSTVLHHRVRGHRIHRGHHGRRNEFQRFQDRVRGSRRRDVIRSEKKIKKAVMRAFEASQQQSTLLAV